ncbi:MAG: hypothetical protein ABI203_01535 [Mucilaginibacter sp.]
MKKNLVILTLLLVLSACGGSKKNDVTPVLPPAAVTLTGPAQNAVCLTGQVISDTQSSVTFTWNSSANTNSYDLVIKDLTTSVKSTESTTQTHLTVTIARGTPFSWYVVSKSNLISKTAESDTWKFYNSGQGIVTYAPFPAEIIAPVYGAEVVSDSGTVNLTWTGSSPGNLTLTYDLYLGTTSAPALLKNNVTDTFLNNVTISSGTTYYWKVISRDPAGNTSDSGLCTFNVK